MSDKQRPRTNPRAGSNDPELWDLDLDWYFNDFDSFCGLQSIGTSGAGQNELVPPTKEEAAERRERIRNGFLLTLPGHAKSDFKSTSASEADAGTFDSLCHGVFSKARRIWRQLSALPYYTQRVLKQAYEERIPEAGADWGRELLSDEQARAAHRQYLGKSTEPVPQPAPPRVRETRTQPWVNPRPCGLRVEWGETHHE